MAKKPARRRATGHASTNWLTKEKETHLQHLINNAWDRIGKAARSDWERTRLDAVGQGYQYLIHSIEQHNRKWRPKFYDAILEVILARLPPNEPSTPAEMKRLQQQIIDRAMQGTEGGKAAWHRQVMGILQANHQYDSSADAAYQEVIDRVHLAHSTYVTTKVEDALRARLIAAEEARRANATKDPKFDPPTYECILQACAKLGRGMETLPSTYIGKDEEALRDHFVLQLNARFQGSATGETFNKSGKTDILLIHEKNTMFVAECKFWRGSAKHGLMIDQLLSYLTWRDSKTALVCFVDRQDVSAVLDAIKQSTRKHVCFRRFIGEKWNHGFQYEFSLPGDAGTKIQVALLVLHFPKKRLVPAGQRNRKSGAEHSLFPQNRRRHPAK